MAEELKNVNQGRAEISTKLPAIPESVLKRRKRRETENAVRLQASLKRRAKNYNKTVVTFKRAEQFVKEHRLKERDEFRLHREAKKHGNHFVTGDSKLAFVIRMRGATQVSPRVSKILKLFRLTQINRGVFVKLNDATVNMFRIIEPYITWGYPNLKTVRDLIFKRGFAKVNGKRTPINSNALIENALGKNNIICTEDLIHEVFTVGENFKCASNFLWPFKLNSPTGGWRKRTIHFVRGGDFGNRKDKINELIRNML